MFRKCQASYPFFDIEHVALPFLQERNVSVTLDLMRIEPIDPRSRVPCPACCSMKEVRLVLHWEGSQSGSDLPTDPFELQIQNLCWGSGEGALRWRLTLLRK